jgi:hypothetical protein
MLDMMQCEVVRSGVGTSVCMVNVVKRTAKCTNHETINNSGTARVRMSKSRLKTDCTAERGVSIDRK